MASSQRGAGTVRILIADDHVLLAQAVARSLVNNGGFDVEITESLDGALRLVNEVQPDILLLDLKMPGMHGLLSVAKVAEKAGKTRVVLFSAQIDPQFVRDALALGIAGYIPKTIGLQSFVAALTLIESGQVFVPQTDVHPLSSRPGATSSDTDLTGREISVLNMSSEGATNKEIAARLGGSESSIKLIMRTICAKLGARNRAHACIIARDRAII
jgi:two-component system nitrate/nitrite response regulator NarP